MKFRPCIDIHNGVVKQIVGSSLTEDAADAPKENFAATVPASDFAERYRRDGLFGGHVIMLGGGCEQAAMGALAAFPGGLQLGGGVTAENADSYLQAGASHVIVTSYVFRDGQVDLERLRLLSEQVGRDRLVVDLSCRKRQRQGQAQGQGQGSATTGTAGTGVAEGGEDLYYVVTNKWTKYTDYAVTPQSLAQLSAYCCEFLVHGVDVEGLLQGIEAPLVRLLGDFASGPGGVPVTYAGGVRTLEDMELVMELGRGAVDCTVGSALDIFGGGLPYQQVADWHKQHNLED